MSYCKKLYDGLDKRLEEHKTIDQIADEMCPEVSKKRDKILKLIKSTKGTDWLFENHEWLGYRVDCIHNPTGGKVRNPNATKRLNDITSRMQKPPTEQYETWVCCISDICNKLEEMDSELVDTTESRHRTKLHALIKRVKELRMILDAGVRF